jgi:hypothetical protein
MEPFKDAVRVAGTVPNDGLTLSQLQPEDCDTENDPLPESVMF